MMGIGKISLRSCGMAVAGLGLCLPMTASYADEPLFGYVYTTDLLPQGKYEVEQWVTDRAQQAHGRFNDFLMSTEVEYGLTNDLQVAGYINYSYLNASHNSVQRLTEGIDIPASHDPTRPFNEWRYDGVSLEFIWRVLSPYKDGFGLAFYAEPEYGPREKGLELRIITQKNFMDDRLVLAANLWVEPKREDSSNLVMPGSDEMPEGGKMRMTMAEIDIGASYRFASNWSAGLEFHNHNEYSGFTLSHNDQDHTAFFIGPNIHYASQRWFLTLAVLHQVHAKAYNEDQEMQIHDGLIFGDEHTRWDGIRMKVGYTFE